MTSKPTNNRHNLQQRNTSTCICANDTDIVGRSHQSAVRNAYIALDREAAKVGLKINEHNIPFEKLDDKILRKYVRQYIDDIECI
jgi:hypothetical protein